MNPVVTTKKIDELIVTLELGDPTQFDLDSAADVLRSINAENDLMRGLLNRANNRECQYHNRQNFDSMPCTERGIGVPWCEACRWNAERNKILIAERTTNVIYVTSPEDIAKELASKEKAIMKQCTWIGCESPKACGDPYYCTTHDLMAHEDKRLLKLMEDAKK